MVYSEYFGDALLQQIGCCLHEIVLLYAFFFFKQKTAYEFET